jgi:hypothetical protein
MTLTETLRYARETPLRATDRCLLCGRPAQCRGVFAPTNSVLYGGNAQQQRVIVYHLCKRCRRRSGFTDQVERRILAAMRSHSN